MTSTQKLLNDVAFQEKKSPEVLDLRQNKFDREYFGNSDDEFNLAEEEGRFPRPVICISGNDTAKIIYFPNEKYEYVVFDDLPNLQELHICRSSDSYFLRGDLQWLICRNLPNLKKITIDSAVLRWLQLDGVGSLESIDVSKAPALDYFSIKNAPSLKNVNVKNCKKLRKISGMTEQSHSSLGITKKIEMMQDKSKKDGKIYKNMTYSDVDIVLSKINLGVKLATRKGMFPEGEDFCSGRENDSFFNNFSFHILRPLECVYTGSSGEIYAYIFLNHNYIGGKYGIMHGIGNSTQENCLSYALHWISMAGLAVPGEKKPSEKKILDYLNNLIAE